MAPALTETEAGQSQKFALTMSPPLPGIAQISHNHTASASYLQNDKHSTNTNNNCGKTYSNQDKRGQQHRRVNGRDREPPKVPGCVSRLDSLSTTGAIFKVSKEQIERKQEPGVNGKTGELAVDESAEGTKVEHSCTMNGKTEGVDGAKSVNRDIEATNKTMGTLKNNVASGFVINSTTNTNGNNGDLEDNLHTVKDLTSTHSTPIVKEESKDEKLGSNSNANKESSSSRENKVTTKTDLASGPGPPQTSSVQPPTNPAYFSNTGKQTLVQVAPFVPNVKNGLNCHKLVSDKIEARQKCQATLERQTSSLLRRIYKLQAKHSAQHVSRQMMGFVCVQRRNLQLPLRIDKPSLLRLKLTSSSAAPTNTSLLDMNDRILQSENAKNLSTSALINLVKNSCNNEIDAGGIYTVASRQLLQQAATSTANNCVRRCNVSKTNAIAAANALASVESLDVKLDSNLCDDIEWTSGNLLTNFHHLEKAIDSDATASSSGGESCDEMDETEERRTRYNIPL